MRLYPPYDPFPYPADANSQIADRSILDGLYAYVQDVSGLIWVLADQPHIHPKVLGLAKSALYAGDLSTKSGEVIDVTNLSGTFQCDDPAGLLAVTDQLVRQGLAIARGAVRFFPSDGSPLRVLK
jgi:hypothetical protein